MKIAFVTPILSPYAIKRYQELSRIKDVEVCVIVELESSSDRIGWKYETIEGVSTYLTKRKYLHKYIVKNKKGSYNKNEVHIFSFDLKKIVDKINPDVVMVCNSCQLLMLLGKHNYRIGVIVEDTLRANEGRNKINSFVKRKLLKTADFYCVFSDDSKEFLKYYSINNNIMKSSWSIDIQDFNNLSDEEKVVFKNENNIESNKTNMLIISNLIKLKGTLEFLNSFDKLSISEKEMIQLYIAGEGPMKNEINSFISTNGLKNVKLLGHVDYDKIKKYLQVCDIFVLPTLEDLNPLVVYEAIAAKKPILLSKYAGNKFLIKEGLNGYLFDPYSCEDTINKINKILNDDRLKMSQCSYEISLNYTNDVVMKRFYEDLKNMM